MVVQFRTDDSEDHEQKCFHEDYNDLSVDLHFKSAISRDLKNCSLENYDGVIFGGSGEYYLTEGAGRCSWRENIFDFINKILKKEKPILGICFGSQLLALHQGGKLVNDEEYHESGSYQVDLTREAENCDIFSNMDSSFSATIAHQDTHIDMPDNLVPLAKSKKVPCQAFKVKGKPAWGTLFHPELNADRLDYRLRLYPSYVDNEHLIDEIIGDFDDTSYSTNVLHHFYHYIADNLD